WVFQPEQVVQAIDDSPALHKKISPIDLAGTDPTVKAENETLAMLYRRQVEFAVGHGVSVHVDVSADPNRAVRVRTKVVPSYEVPRTTPPKSEDADRNPAFAKLTGLVLDMK